MITRFVDFFINPLKLSFSFDIKIFYSSIFDKKTCFVLLVIDRRRELWFFTTAKMQNGGKTFLAEDNDIFVVVCPKRVKNVANFQLQFLSHIFACKNGEQI